jgi:hypothetical protein
VSYLGVYLYCFVCRVGWCACKCGGRASLRSGCCHWRRCCPPLDISLRHSRYVCVPPACRRVAYDIPCARKNSQSSLRCNAHAVRQVGIKCAAASLVFVCLQRLELQLHYSGALLSLCCYVCRQCLEPPKKGGVGACQVGEVPRTAEQLGVAVLSRFAHLIVLCCVVCSYCGQGG